MLPSPVSRLRTLNSHLFPTFISVKTKTDKPKVTDLPVVSLEKTEQIIHVRPLEYNNPYDHTREHRHTYFEIMFFDTGGGMQLIDFQQFEAQPNSCHIIFPQQIHLLKRNNSTGTIVQFVEEVIPSVQVRNQLRQVLFGDKPAIFFESSEERMQDFRPLLDLLKTASEKKTKISNDIAIKLLEALLLQLVEGKQSVTTTQVSEDQRLLFHFQQLLEEQFTHNHSVQEYVKLMNATEKKLAAATKKFLGLSPLQVIHNRVLLEAKRALVFEDTSHKEIAFRLGFDSPASFSQFIKNKTGYSPSELSSHLVDIHK